MPPFEYKPFINPYIGSISELMGKGDEAKAEALLRIGEIQARAAEQQGQAWGNAIQGLGNIGAEYLSPKAREARAIEKGQRILDANAKRRITEQGQRMIPGTLQPSSTSLEFVAPESRGIGADVFSRINFGASSRPSVTTDETFALAQADPNGQTIDNALPNEGLRNALSRSNVFGPTERLPGKTSSVAQAGMQPSQRESLFGRMEKRITPPRMSAPQVETYDKAPRNRYTTAQGLYDVRLAYDDLVRAGVSTKIATALAGQGQQANSIFAAYDKDKEELDKKLIAVRGSIAHMAIQLMDTGMSAQDALTQASGPAGNRLSQDDMNAFAVQLNNQPTEQDKRALFLSEVKAWDDQGVSQVVNPGDYVVNKNSGTGTQYGTRPVPPVSSADRREAERIQAFEKAVANGYDGTRDKFEAEQARGPASLPTSIQEYEFAVKQGYKKSFEQWSIEDANRRRQAAGNNAEVSPTALLNATMSLRTQVSRETNASRLVDVQLANMEASLKAVQGDSDAAGSQGVLVTFQKILDPLSVVRESEYARSAQGLSLLAAIQGKYDLYMEGGAGVPVKELEKFVALARQFAQNQRNSNAVTMESVSSIVEQYKINPKSVFGNSAPTPKAEPNISNEGGGQIGAQGNAAVAPGGRGVPPPSTNRIRIVNLKDGSTGTILASDPIPFGYRKQ